MSVQQDIREFGWTAVPRNVETILGDKAFLHSPTAVHVEDIPFPSSRLAQEIQTLVQEELTEQTYNHSMRVYYYGIHIYCVLAGED